MLRRSAPGLFINAAADFVLVHVVSINPLKLQELGDVRIVRSDSSDLSDHPDHCATVVQVPQKFAERFIAALKKDPNIRLVNGNLTTHNMVLPTGPGFKP